MFVITITVMAAGTPDPVIPSGVIPVRHIGCQATRFRAQRAGVERNTSRLKRVPPKPALFSIQALFETKLGAPAPRVDIPGLGYESTLRISIYFVLRRGSPDNKASIRCFHRDNCMKHSGWDEAHFSRQHCHTLLVDIQRDHPLEHDVGFVALKM